MCAKTNLKNAASDVILVPYFAPSISLLAKNELKKDWLSFLLLLLVNHFPPPNHESAVD